MNLLSSSVYGMHYYYDLIKSLLKLENIWAKPLRLKSLIYTSKPQNKYLYKFIAENGKLSNGSLL